MTCASLGQDGQPTLTVQHVRLFANLPEHRWAGRVHEQIAPAVWQNGGALWETDILLQHVGYQERPLFVRKVERNLRLLELEYERRPLDGWFFYQRGGALFDLGHFAQAIVDLNIALPLAARDVAPRVHALLAEAYAHERRLDEALAIVREGRASFDSASELLLLEAQLLAALGHYDSAEACLVNLLDAAPELRRFAVVDTTLAMRGRHLLARVFALQGRCGESETLLKDIIRLRPAFGPAWLALGDALLAREALEEFDALSASLPDAPETSTARAVLATSREIHHGDHDRALVLANAALAEDPESVFLQAAYVRALAAAGRPELGAALGSLLRLDPLHVEGRAAQRASTASEDHAHPKGHEEYSLGRPTAPRPLSASGLTGGPHRGTDMATRTCGPQETR
jgi:tetratricopeptide (TPR) repeat protein